jgi:hypothetical protein
MSDVANKAVDAGGIASILIGASSWFGANLPTLVLAASFCVSVCAIVRYVYLFYRWLRRKE